MRRRLLYFSRLARGVRYDAFTSICRESRSRNRNAGISGVLLFDGHRFCQMLDGPQGPVGTTWARISSDRRHEDIVVLQYRPHDLPTPADEGWLCGFCGPNEMDCFEGDAAPRGEAALAAMYDILSRADVVA